MTTPKNENNEDNSEILFSLNSLPMWLSSLATSCYVSKHYMLDLKNPYISHNQSVNSYLTIDKCKKQVNLHRFDPVKFEKQNGLPYDYNSPECRVPARKVHKSIHHIMN